MKAAKLFMTIDSGKMYRVYNPVSNKPLGRIFINVDGEMHYRSKDGDHKRMQALCLRLRAEI